MEERSSQLFTQLKQLRKETLFHPQFILHGYITNLQYDQLPAGLHSSVGRALYRHCRGHGFDSRSNHSNMVINSVPGNLISNGL